MWKIEPITISDATAIAKNTCGAFWEEPMWRLQWSGIQIPDTDTEITPEFLASQLVKRQPLRLLQDRDTLRYQKAVDPETGELVGYARWRLPETATTTTTHNGDESNEEEKTKEAKEAKWAWAWTDAQIPDISATDKTLLEKVAETVWWEPRTDIDVLDEGNDEVKNRIMEGRGEYMGESTNLSYLPAILVFFTSLTDCGFTPLPLAFFILFLQKSCPDKASS